MMIYKLMNMAAMATSTANALTLIVLAPAVTANSTVLTMPLIVVELPNGRNSPVFLL